MRKIIDFKLYTTTATQVRFKSKSYSDPFVIIYFSENSDFITDYPSLNILRADVPSVFIPRTTIPKFIPTNTTKKAYQDLGLRTFVTGNSPPKNKNIIVDISHYLRVVDEKYHPSNYRLRAGMFILNHINEILASFPQNYIRTLLYTTNLRKPLNKIVNRRIFPILTQLKDNNFPINYFMYATIQGSAPKYRLLVKDNSYDFNRMFAFLRQAKNDDINDEVDEGDENIPDQPEDRTLKQTAELAADKVVDTVIKHKETSLIKDPIKIKQVTANYLQKDKAELQKIVSGQDVNKNHAIKTVISSVLYGISGNLMNSKSITNKIAPETLPNALKKIDDEYTDNLLIQQTPVNKSTDEATSLYNIPKAVDNKYPGHLFQKRNIDFKINLKSDMKNAFSILSTKEIPLKVKSLYVSEKPSRTAELMKSDISTITVTLEDDDKKTHEVSIDIPRIDEKSGTFNVNGQRKCLVNQIILCPISFPKPHDSKFESSYSSFHLWSKQTKRFKYLEIYMGSYKVPLLVVLCYAFGTKNTFKRYGIDYEITDVKPKKDVYSCPINSTQYIIFKNVDSELKKQLCESLVVSKIDKYDITKSFEDKEFFNNLIIKLTGRINSTYLISSNLENIVDPISKQVLINKRLPYELEDIMQYMAVNVIKGTVHDRNDLAFQRIRGSEVIVTLAQSQILGAYTEYKEQVLSGNLDAEFKLQPGKVLSNFVNSQIVVDMEYANPIEELSTLTRISPVGKNIGGIPDRRAVQGKALNVHPSYFGNIDPLDTPEGGNIGVVQQLAMGAYITSARGLFNTKTINNDERAGMLSTSSSLVPFLEHNDQPRMIMGTQQGKQMLPLKDPEPPIVMTGYESLLTDLLSNKFVKKSPCSGKIVEVLDSEIRMICTNGDKRAVDITPEHLRSGSGKDTLSIFTSNVKVGDVVKENAIVAEGACIATGSIALGRSLLAAVMPYKGYNFDDGIAINERVCKKLTSLHGIIEEVLISESDRLLEIIKIGTETKKGDVLLRKTIGELEQLLGYEDDEDESIVQKGQEFIKKSPGGKIVDIDVFSNVPISKYPQLKSLIEKTDKRYRDGSREKYSIRGEGIKGVLVKFKIEQELISGEGDKLCNRHGNKGIISLVEKDEFMPRTPWGETVDIVVNPIGIANRQTVGQILEMYCGFISRELALRIMKMTSKSAIIDLLKKVLSLLDATKDKILSRSIIFQLEHMSNQNFKKFHEDVSKRGFYPLVIPPFRSPGYKNVVSAMKVLGLKSGYIMSLPEFGTKTMHEVPVGYMYFAKLEHIAKEKLHSVSVGPKVSKTGQPTAGKRREGGQRLGEAETYALLSYDCPLLLSELFGAMSDDSASRDEMIAEILQNGKCKFKKPKMTPTKDLLNAYFKGLGLQRI